MMQNMVIAHTVMAKEIRCCLNSLLKCFLAVYEMDVITDDPSPLINHLPVSGLSFYMIKVIIGSA